MITNSLSNALSAWCHVFVCGNASTGVMSTACPCGSASDRSSDSGAGVGNEVGSGALEDSTNPRGFPGVGKVVCCAARSAWRAAIFSASVIGFGLKSSSLRGVTVVLIDHRFDSFT